jgi:dTDP-4-amino-4,6-dideoxygalactose transaminase
LANHSFIPVAKPWLGQAEADAASRVVLSGWVTQGAAVAEFEHDFAEYVGATHACAVANCTVGLHLALRACGIGAGDEVITVSHSYISTANSIRYCGAVPVFIDIEPNTFNINPTYLEQAITARTRAILCVHQMGMPCDIQAITDIAHGHNLPVIEDAACAIGSDVKWHGNWNKIGKPHGDIACFSFHPRKLLTTGDGGMITTSNPERDKQFRLWRQHGMSVPDTVRHTSGQVIFEEYVAVGYNYRMTDIQAAVGIEQLKRIPEMVDHRREQVHHYQHLLADVPGLILPTEPAWGRSNWQSFCIRIPSYSNQREVMQTMLDAGVATRRGIMCSHREPAYTDEPWTCGDGPRTCGCPSGQCKKLSESEKGQDFGVILPLYHEMTSDAQSYVAKVLRKVILR